MTSWGVRSHTHPRYVDMPGMSSGEPTGHVTSGRLNRSCECVEALSWASWSDFEAYPAECESPEVCTRWLACTRLARRQAIISSAQLRVHWMRLSGQVPPIAR